MGKLQRDHNEVKWIEPGRGVQYGLASMYGPEEKFNERAARGVVLVEHAVFPYSFEVEEGLLVDLKGPFGRMNADGVFWGGCECRNYVSLSMLLHEALQPSGNAFAPGRMFTVGVGDGYAHYVVTAVKRVNCDVEWRGFSGDRWVARPFGYGGSFRRKDVEQYCRPGIRGLFGDSRQRPRAEVFADLCKEFGDLPNDLQEGLELLRRQGKVS
jgi:hypothetical protein